MNKFFWSKLRIRPRCLKLFFLIFEFSRFPLASLSLVHSLSRSFSLFLPLLSVALYKKSNCRAGRMLYKMKIRSKLRISRGRKSEKERERECTREREASGKRENSKIRKKSFKQRGRILNLLRFFCGPIELTTNFLIARKFCLIKNGSILVTLLMKEILLQLKIR